MKSPSVDRVENYHMDMSKIIIVDVSFIWCGVCLVLFGKPQMLDLLCCERNGWKTAVPASRLHIPNHLLPELNKL